MVWRIHTAAKLIGFAEIVTERFVALLTMTQREALVRRVKGAHDAHDTRVLYINKNILLFFRKMLLFLRGGVIMNLHCLYSLTWYKQNITYGGHYEQIRIP